MGLSRRAVRPRLRPPPYFALLIGDDLGYAAWEIPPHSVARSMCRHRPRPGRASFQATVDSGRTTDLPAAMHAVSLNEPRPGDAGTQPLWRDDNVPAPKDGCPDTPATERRQRGRCRPSRTSSPRRISTIFSPTFGPCRREAHFLAGKSPRQCGGFADSALVARRSERGAWGRRGCAVDRVLLSWWRAANP